MRPYMTYLPMTPEEKCKMAVGAVKIEADAYMVCLTHALSTEREEVMGLLIGEVFYCRHCHLSAVLK